jgi:hypothetical protein
MVLGVAEIRFSNKKSLEMTQRLSLLAAISDGPIALDWGQARIIDLPAEDLEQAPDDAGQFSSVPQPASKSRNYESWKKELATWIYRNQRLELLESPSLGLASNPGESERDFRVRLQQLAREKRDEKIEKLRQKFAPKLAALEEKRRRAQQTVEREAEQASSQKMQTAISFGATVLSSFFGRKTLSLSTLGRATTAARGVSRSMKESADVGRAQDTVESVTQRLQELDADLKAETESIQQTSEAQTETLETISLKPTKSNIDIRLVTLAWTPYWRDAQGQIVPGWE